jgi:predicted RNase H-like HicB family nuclease
MQPGRLLRDRYQIEEPLATGGFGETFLAVDTDLPSKPQVVVKLLKTKIFPYRFLAISLTMNKEFNVIIERDADGYFVASVPSLPGCHTQAKSLDELMERIKEAIILCLEVQSQPIENLEFIGLQRVAIEI